MQNIKYFITGGGTGGHIYPALAILNALVNSGVDKKTQIFYLGNKNNLEYQITKEQDINFLHYSVCGMPRKISFKLLKFAVELFFSTIKALFYALKYKPNVIFATGGYVCAPILFVAKFLKIPYVLHDCDAHPGIVSRTFASGAKYMSLAFDSAINLVKTKNPKVCGNPIRAEFKNLDKISARNSLNLGDKFTVLIMGGSLGAKTINNATFSVIEKYANDENIQIIWQTGKKNYQEVLNKIGDKLPKNLLLRPYFENMTQALIASDVVISRAGSLSLSEICACGLPSILIPYPYAAADHQRINAKKMCELGASVYLDDNDCNGEKLLEILSNLIIDKNKLDKMAQNAKNNAKINATCEILELINKAVEK